MKRLPSLVLIAALVPALQTLNANAAMPAGQVDFGSFSPPANGGEYVEVNITSNLISLAARFLDSEQPEAAKVLRSVQQVRANVVGLDEQNQAEIQQRVQRVRADLDGKGWERIVRVQKQDQDVSVHLKMHEKDTVQGLAVLVVEGKKQAVFVNIVGDIRPEQISMLGEKLHIDALKRAGAAAEKE